jgi:L-aminopeptidase/D-esterase-like protein
VRNLITDVPGLRVGNAHDARAATGVTVAMFEQSTMAGVATLGGAPGSRATSILEPEMTRGLVDAVVFSGGSLYGLDAAGGVSAVLCAQGKGAQFGGLTLPTAVQAILFDLTNGGEKDWLKEPVDKRPPYWDLGRDAALAAGQDFALGTVGAGYGATTVGLKGGLGSASARTEQGFVVGALVAVNAIGSAVIGEGPHFWAAPYEQGSEFGGRGWPQTIPPEAHAMRFKRPPPPATATSIGLVATDARLTNAECKRLAIMANAGLAKSLRPVNAPTDGDTVFAAATGSTGADVDPFVLAELGTVAADCLARAVARGVYEAVALPYKTSLPDWKSRFGGAR